MSQIPRNFKTQSQMAATDRIWSDNNIPSTPSTLMPMPVKIGEFIS
jgi:hypothetical protein